MIKFENVSVMNMDNAIRGMRNPYNSWDKRDSYECDWDLCSDCEHRVEGCGSNLDFVFGQNDLKLAKSLVKAGTSHRKFMRQILVSVDITAPLYWWKEFDTYKVGTTSNSCSTMHTIHKKEFTLDDFSVEHIDYDGNEIMEFTLNHLNNSRDKYLVTKNKKYWWQMIQLLPTCYNQMRTITLNYEVILNIKQTRKGHKLDEWNEFVNWADSLPYFKDFTEE